MKKLVIAVVSIVTMGAQWRAQTTTIYPTIPVTTIRDYSQPGVKVETQGRSAVAYPTLGTSISDDSQPGAKAETDGHLTSAYPPTLPGTTIRNYSQPGVKVETQGGSTYAYPTFSQRLSRRISQDMKPSPHQDDNHDSEKYDAPRYAQSTLR